MEPLQLWRWHLPDLKGRLKPSTWRMTEAQAQARYPGCTRVEGSLELRNPSGYDASHSWHSGLVRRASDGAMLAPAPVCDLVQVGP